jgi:hypothetical protein
MACCLKGAKPEDLSGRLVTSFYRGDTFSSTTRCPQRGATQCSTCKLLEVFTAVTMKNADFWDVALCRYYVNGRFGRRSVHTRSTQRRIPEDGIPRSSTCVQIYDWLDNLTYMDVDEKFVPLHTLQYRYLLGY